MLGYDACAATVLNGDLVNPIRMQYEHAGVTGYRIFADHAGVVELQLEPYRLQGYLDECFADPFLRLDHEG